MNNLRDKSIALHIKKNYPSAKIIDYGDAQSQLEFYTADQLQEVSKNWFPLCCYLDEKTKKVVYGGRDNIFHTYTEGETGAGKTTRFVMQSIRALSSMKEKPSFVIADIHGEIVENLYSHLRNNGYEVKIINCDEPERSDTYNPFTEMAKECMETGKLSHEVTTKIRRIAEIIQPVESRNEPIWEQGACSYTNGCILDKFEDLINGELPQECLTIYNIIQNHFWIRRGISARFDDKGLFNISHYDKKGSQALSVQKMIAVTNNAERTRNSYFGVIENHYDAFGQPALYQISSNNTIDIQEFIEKPMAIVIQSGNTKIGDNLISLLMNDIYSTVVRLGKKSPTKQLPRKIHCFLDEFANCNIASGSEYIRMLTTSRKFGMYWHMLVQCDAQIDYKFDRDIGKIIRANCTEIFMGTNDYETMYRFAKSCGQHTIESLESIFMQDIPSIATVDLITAEQLNLTEEGYLYIKSGRHEVLKSYFEAFYNCPEFERTDNISEIYPYNTFDYTTTEFYPNDIPKPVSKTEWEILLHLNEQPSTYEELKKAFGLRWLKYILLSLKEKDMIEDDKDGVYHMLLTKRQFDFLKQRKVFAEDELFDKKESDEISLSGGKMFDMLEAMPPDRFNPLIRTFGTFVKKNKHRLKETALHAYTCIPEFFKDAYEYYYNVEEEPYDEEWMQDFPEDLSVLKFRIIEEFISNNEMFSKKSFDKKFEQEVQSMKQEKLFPATIIKCFQEAVCEEMELTYGNIKEIRKLIDDYN